MPRLLRAPATAKLNLALVVGPPRADGLHPVVSVLQRLALADRVSLEPASELDVTGYPADTLVRQTLGALAERAGVRPGWHVRLTKRVPVAAGLGGGSSDAATALRLANGTLERPLRADELHEVAAGVGADVPFFLTQGPQLARGSGIELERLQLPSDYWVVLLLPFGARKESTAAVYRAFDSTERGQDFDGRRARLLATLAEIRSARDLARLPPNDLVHSPLAVRLTELGAFRADVSGAGPVVYGLFHDRAEAQAARRRIAGLGHTWLTVPAWYG